jgi:amidase
VDEIAFHSATELLAGLRERRFSSVELLDRYLGRIERLNGPVNAFVTLDAERARERAAETDAARARGEDLGPLHGLPMTVKDAFETAGLRTTAGAAFLSGHVPERDADAVARLRAAGAVIFAKTNLPFLARDGQSYNDVAGVTANPWDLTRTPGGSSGGSAAALAAGFTALELGSDISGSIRHPASFSGVFGLKPSHGVVPTRGHIPGLPGTLAEVDMNTAGPLARSADDLELALDVLAGPNDESAKAWRLELPPPRADDLRSYRLAVQLDDEACRVDREVVAVLRQAADALADVGAVLEERPMPVPLADSIRVHRTLLFSTASTGLSDEEFAALDAAVRAGDADGDTDWQHHMRLLVQSKRAWNRTNEERARMRARWAEFFAGYDAVLCPSVPLPAIPHDHEPDLALRSVEIDGERRSYWEQTCWIAPASLAYLPAASVPVGLTGAGLPVGMQIVGPFLEERTVIDLARRTASVAGGFTAPAAFAGVAGPP